LVCAAISGPFPLELEQAFHAPARERAAGHALQPCRGRIDRRALRRWVEPGFAPNGCMHDRRTGAAGRLLQSRGMGGSTSAHAMAGHPPLVGVQIPQLGLQQTSPRSAEDLAAGDSQGVSARTRTARAGAARARSAPPAIATVAGRRSSARPENQQQGDGKPSGKESHVQHCTAQSSKAPLPAPQNPKKSPKNRPKCAIWDVPPGLGTRRDAARGRHPASCPWPS